MNESQSDFRHHHLLLQFFTNQLKNYTLRYVNVSVAISVIVPSQARIKEFFTEDSISEKSENPLNMSTPLM